MQIPSPFRMKIVFQSPIPPKKEQIAANSSSTTNITNWANDEAARCGHDTAQTQRALARGQPFFEFPAPSNDH